jgi:hypothetical protein
MLKGEVMDGTGAAAAERTSLGGRHRWRRGLTLLAAGALAMTGAALLSPSAGAAPSATAQQCGNAQAAPTLTVDRTTLDSAATTTVNITGTSYLLPPHVCGTQVPGGIYVFFGWVQPGGTWGPSHKSPTSTNGLFGYSYSYPGEGGGAETRDDGSGTVRLVSFTNAGESGSATDFHMDGAGNWSTSVVVRGSSYSFRNVVTGAQNTVDCLAVQCGVFTIGAHGNASATNEQFTPINFTVAGGAPVVPVQGAAPGAGAGGSASGGGAAPSDAGTATGDASGAVGGTANGGSGGASTDGSTTTTVASEVGSIGEAGGDADIGDDAADDEVVDAENAASVQEFGSDGGGGGGAVIAIAGVVVLLAVIGGVVVVMRRRGADGGAAS